MATRIRFHEKVWFKLYWLHPLIFGLVETQGDSVRVSRILSHIHTICTYQVGDDIAFSWGAYSRIPPLPPKHNIEKPWQQYHHKQKPQTLLFFPSSFWGGNLECEKLHAYTVRQFLARGQKVAFSETSLSFSGKLFLSQSCHHSPREAQKNKKRTDTKELISEFLCVSITAKSSSASHSELWCWTGNIRSMLENSE